MDIRNIRLLLDLKITVSPKGGPEIKCSAFTELLKGAKDQGNKQVERRHAS